MAIFLLFSQLTLAKDRIQYHVQNFDGSTLKVMDEQGVVTQSYQYAPFGQQLQFKKPSNLKNPNAFVGGVQDADDLVYLKARHYNPVLGRFYQPDPVTFIMKGHGQTDRYQYGWNDSYTYVDSTGGVVLPIVTGAIGGVFGGGVSIVAQLYKDGAVNWREVGVATTVGAVAGAVSPWTATTTFGAIATGSTANALQYAIKQKVLGQEINPNQLVLDAVTGAIGGGIGGTVVSKLSLPVATNSIFISKSLAQRVNNNQLFYANVGNQTLYRNLAANIISTDMFKFAAYSNTYMLNTFQTDVFIQGQKDFNPIQYEGGLHLEISKAPGER
ncbi:RHS repeat-associated core domain-containing protein [Acinetobacter gerneri]|uniref:RHS repeat-associated core domain-containing protein n=1 Tax=Acinetobacter gerneri TaxID=202952 RepID=UPI003D1DA5EB